VPIKGALDVGKDKGQFGFRQQDESEFEAGRTDFLIDNPGKKRTKG